MNKARVQALTTILPLCVAALIVLAALRSTREESPDRPSAARVRLVAAAGPVRPSEGRLSGGFAYAPWAPDRAAPHRPSRELIQAGILIERAVNRDGSARSLADLAVVHLLLGDSGRAASLLVRAAAQDPSDAAIRTDLSAAFLASATAHGSFKDLLQALEAADEAVGLAPSCPEARFNRALALERLALRFQARAGWSAYLTLDGRSDWSREAGAHLSALARPESDQLWQERSAAFDGASPRALEATARTLAQGFPQQARELAEELPGRWALAQARGEPAAAEQELARLRALGAALQERNGDRSILLSVRSITAARNDPHELSRLISAHADLQEGFERYRLRDYGPAARFFSAAVVPLREAASPFELRAQLGLALCEYRSFQYDDSLRHLEDIAARAARLQDPAPQARALWMAGLIHGIRGNPAEALSSYRKSWEIYHRLGEKGNLARVSTLLAEMHRNLGDFPEAWRFHGIALEGLPFLASLDQRQPILDEIGVSLAAENRPRLAIYFHEEILRDRTSPAGAPGAFRTLAEAQYQAGSLQAAVASLRREADKIALMPPGPDRETLLGDLTAARGEAEAGLSAEHAIALLTAAIESYKRTDYHQQLISLYYQRAKSLQREGRTGLAEIDLERAIRLIEAYRPPEGIDTADFGRIRAVFDEMVSLQVRLGRPMQALRSVEAGRSRILSLMAPGADEAIVSLGPEEIRKALPSGAVVLESWLGDDRIFLWSLRRDGMDFAAVPIDRQRLFRTVEAFRKAIADEDPAAVGRLGSRLHTILIEPLKHSLNGADPLILVPDWKLSGLPFPALQREIGGRYLIEDHALTTAPAASVYLACLRRAAQRKGPLGVLALGNPLGDASLFPTLASLPGAEAEAGRIAGFYPRSRVLLKAAATRERWLAELDQWPVIHFGGHAVSNPANPSLSALVLAPAGRDNGVFYLRDFPASRLKRVRLMVLAACSTLAGDSSDAAPAIATPLLARGVPAVVGTLWPVSDQDAEAMASDFHRRFAAGNSVAHALRDAQLSCLHGQDSQRRNPLHWAGFLAIGS
ncbi:MAG: CHAT domain-containing protein [Acidobacteriota bacterium]